MEILPPKYQKYRMFPQLQQNDENEQMQKALEFSGELLILQARLYPIPNFEYIWPDGLPFTKDKLDGDGLLCLTINVLNFWRKKYIKTKDKKYWWQMIQLLPSSYNQKRTIMLNYEVLAGIYPMRKSHKLDEWVEFCKWIETLPYSEIIIGEKVKFYADGKEINI